MKNNIDLVVQFSASNDLLLEATTNALEELAGILEENSTDNHYKLLTSAQPAAKSYEGFLATLQIIKSEGALKVYRDHNMLVISGSPGNCIIFAANLRFLCQETLSQPSMQSVLHIHIEYFPDHPYLDPVSDPVVIYVRAA